MSSHGHGHPARRSSYASVLSGNSTNSPQQAQNQQPVRSGFMSNLASSDRGLHSASAIQPPATSPTPQHQHQRSEPFSTLNASNLATSPTSQAAGGSTLAYSMGPAGDGFGGIFMDSRPPETYIPRYLKDTKYAEKLEERYKARLASHKDGKSARLSTGGTLSTSSSSHNLSKSMPSHRGMTYDIVEKPINPGVDDVPPLPSRWSLLDKAGGIDVHTDGLDIRVIREPKSQDEAVSIRADHPMPREAGIYYYELTNLSQSRDCTIAIGFAGPRVVLSKLPGWEADSWAYHGDDGVSFYSNNQGRGYGPKWGFGDVIGCAINFRTGTAFFTRNGVHLGTAFHSIPKSSTQLYPCVGMKKGTDRLRANFGQYPFSFNIENFVQDERNILLREIDSTDATPDGTSLLFGQSEDRQLEYLVAQYLAHEGYIDTARAFSRDVGSSRALLRSNEMTNVPDDIMFKDDLDAVHRQHIREAILRGDVDTALKETRAHYPSVLEDNENIYFKLRCRRFIEMIAQSAELQRAIPPKAAASKVIHSRVDMINQHTNGHTRRHHNPEAMDVDHGDDSDDDADEEDTMDVAEDDEATNRETMVRQYTSLTQQTIAYGQELQSEFNDDPRKEIRDALKETFALLAYQDVKKSSLAYMLDKQGRAPVAEELNCAILASQGKSPTSALERLVQQTEVLLSDAAHEVTLVNLNQFLR